MKTILTAEKNHPLYETELLVETVQKLSLARDIEEVMQIVRSVARKLTGAQGATFVLREENLCYYADEDAISPLWKGSRFPMEDCISGWVMINKTPAVIEDIYADERIPASAYKATFVKSLVMVPIRTMEPLGAIGNYWAQHHKPGDGEIRMLQALADITAVSIENIEVRNTLEKKVTERTSELADALAREKEIHKLKTTFVSMTSHELRTPLSTILSSISLIEKYPLTDDQHKREKHIARIKSSVNHLVNLLDDFLSLGKIEEGRVHIKNEDFNLHEFFQEISAGFDSMKKKDQQINFTFKGPADVKLDKKVLRNVMLNLISNAIKYSAKDIDIKTKNTGKNITISISDYGIGIPKEHQEKIFSKFFRAGNVSYIEGTGLGLNIVKHYVEILQGTITFTSEENIGTTFTVIVPNWI